MVLSWLPSHDFDSFSQASWWLDLPFCLGIGQMSFLCPSFCFFSYLYASDLVVARFYFGLFCVCWLRLIGCCGVRFPGVFGWL